MAKSRFCLCPNPRYQDGKCVYCGDEIGETKKSQEQSRSMFTRSGSCICKVSAPGPEGFCLKCRRKSSISNDSGENDSPGYRTQTEHGDLSEKQEKNFNSNTGWYPDPTTGELRYFDGNTWLDIPAPNPDSKEFDHVPRNQVKKPVAVKKRSSVETSIYSSSNLKHGSSNSPNDSLGPNSRLPKALIFFGVIAIVIFFVFQIAGGSNPQRPADTSSNEDGRWISKCRKVSVPNPNYPGDQVPLSERIGIPRNFFQEQCTDVYVRD